MSKTPPVGTFKQRLTYAPAAALIWGIGKLPFRWRSNIGGWAIRGPLGRIARYRKRVEANLAMVMPHLSDIERAQITNDCLTNAGRTFLENLYPRDLRKFAKDKTIVWGKGLNALGEAMEAGRPIQFISGHFGNHEAFRNAFYDRGLSIGGLYKPMSNPFFNMFYEKTLDMDGKGGAKFPTGREGITAYRKALSAGDALVLLLDVAVKEGEVFDFLDQPARTSTAAAAFALKADALYIPYFSMRTAEGFSVEIAEAIPHSDPLTMTKEASNTLEDRIRQSPENWFWLHRRWKYGTKG